MLWAFHRIAYSKKRKLTANEYAEARILLMNLWTRKKTGEHKQKISEAGKGRTYTEFQKEKLRMSNLGKTQKHSRTILALCIKTNMPKEFNNISEAARFFNTTHQRIKNNTVADWDITVNDPLIHINDLKKHNNDSES